MTWLTSPAPSARCLGCGLADLPTAVANDVLRLLGGHLVLIDLRDLLTVLHDHDAIGNAVDLEDICRGGNLGIARALAELELDTPPVFIGHELNPNSRQLLLEDRMHAVIDHDTVTEMRWCFEQLRRHRAGAPDPKLFVQQPPRLVLRENID